jgi:hypothetical protein
MDHRGAVIHCNVRMAHQVAWAEAFAAGFARHGQACEITADPAREGGIHVVLGPHYALRHWQDHPRCVHLDRAWWGDPDRASIGWANPDGTRKFPLGDTDREKPLLAAHRIGRDAIVLPDYGDTGEDMAALLRPHVESVTIRRHPAEGGIGTLAEALTGKHIAIGGTGTSLVEAAIAGLAVICRDPRNPAAPVASSTPREIKHADRTDWLHRLSWGNWSHAEIESGELWECLTTRCD